MKTSTLIIVAITAVLTFFALDFEKMFLATLIPVCGLVLILALAVLRWRLDVWEVSPKQERRAHEHLDRMRRVGA